MSDYIIEVWDPKSRKYVRAWTGGTLEQAERMVRKPYYRRHTRRMLRVKTEVLYVERGSKP